MPPCWWDNWRLPALPCTSATLQPTQHLPAIWPPARCRYISARGRTHLAEETEMSPNTINRMLSAVKRLMREAAAQGYIPHAAADAFKDVLGVKAVALKERIEQRTRSY